MAGFSFGDCAVPLRPTYCPEVSHRFFVMTAPILPECGPHKHSTRRELSFRRPVMVPDARIRDYGASLQGLELARSDRDNPLRRRDLLAASLALPFAGRP